MQGAVYLSGGDNDLEFNFSVNNTSMGSGGAIIYTQHCYDTSIMVSPSMWSPF